MKMFKDSSAKYKKTREDFQKEALQRYQDLFEEEKNNVWKKKNISHIKRDWKT